MPRGIGGFQKGEKDEKEKVHTDTFDLTGYFDAGFFNHISPCLGLLHQFEENDSSGSDAW